MEQTLQRKGLVNCLLLLVLGTVGAVVARFANSDTGLVTSVFMALGFLVSAVSYFQMRLHERERLEQLEVEELKHTKASGALFTDNAGEIMPASRARRQFERYFVPGFAVALLILQAVAVYLLWRNTGESPATTSQQYTVSMTLFALFALVYFQFGKYSAVLARLEKQGLLRPSASYLMLGAVLCVTVAGVDAAGWAGYPKVDGIAARILIVLLGLVAAENLLALVFEIYRPRLKGQAAHPLYESRLIGLLGQPGGLITTAAQALDYQFGFKVSETWFYRFLEKALAWIILLQLTVLMLSTTVVFVQSGEQALLERFGKPAIGRSVLGPGAHLKFPWPIDRVYRYDTALIQSFKVGLVTDDAHESERMLLWTKSHAKTEYDMIVASEVSEQESTTSGEKPVPVNLLAVDIPVQYQIHDLPAFVYNYEDAGNLLQLLAWSEVTRYLVNVDINAIMSVGRRKAADDLQQRIQQRADDLKLGVKILFVGLHGIHPPVKVAPDYEKVIGAMQDKETTNLYALAYRAELLPLASAEAAERTNRAAAYLERTTAEATGNAARFTNQVAAYHASPAVYMLRTYLDVLGKSIASTRKYVVVPTNTHDVVTFNLEDKLRADILNELRISSPTNR